MRISVQVENLQILKEAVQSHCDKIRFGSEFCERKIPSKTLLQNAYTLVHNAGKEFVYQTPRVSNRALETIRDHFDLLNDMDSITVVINDLGVLNIIAEYPDLNPHLGRQLIYIPSRCPWSEITEHKMDFFARRRVAKIFYQTSLNYQPTIQFYKDLGVHSVDVDWIPKSFPSFNFLVKNGMHIIIQKNN